MIDLQESLSLDLLDHLESVVSDDCPWIVGELCPDGWILGSIVGSLTNIQERFASLLIV